jgi:D-glycero-D-manno-heptose 1,7-bisphosphate phosphatase
LLGVPLDNVPVIGDSSRDIDAALAVGARPLLVLTGNGRETAAALLERGVTVETFADLGEAVDMIIEEKGNA